jgi:KaiC/GvpD/RAD55 family RecA-like ATPase
MGRHALESAIQVLPLLKEIVPSGLTYGANYLVEFEPDSLWYETSISWASHALTAGVRVDYHTFQHDPKRVRADIERLKPDLNKLEEEGTFRMWDTYTAASGKLHVPEEAQKTGPAGSFWNQSVKVSFWSRSVLDIKGSVPEQHKKRLHIDDNTSILNRYNDENEIVDFWRTRAMPTAVSMEWAMVHALVARVHSDVFYRYFESSCDGIIDFDSREENGEILQYVRARMIRGKPFDSHWHRLQTLDNGEVALGAVAKKDTQLGIGRWLKGPKRP